MIIKVNLETEKHLNLFFVLYIKLYFISVFWTEQIHIRLKGADLIVEVTFPFYSLPLSYHTSCWLCMPSSIIQSLGDHPQSRGVLFLNIWVLRSNLRTMLQRFTIHEFCCEVHHSNIFYNFLFALPGPYLSPVLYKNSSDIPYICHVILHKKEIYSKKDLKYSIINLLIIKQSKQNNLNVLFSVKVLNKSWCMHRSDEVGVWWDKEKAVNYTFSVCCKTL